MFTVPVYPLEITLQQCWKSGMLWQFSRIRLPRFFTSKWQCKVINSNHSGRKEKTYMFWDYLLCLPRIILQYFFHAWAKWGSSIYLLAITNMITLLIDTSPVGVHCSGDKSIRSQLLRYCNLIAISLAEYYAIINLECSCTMKKNSKCLETCLKSVCVLHLLEAGLAISDKVPWSTHTWRNDCNKNWTQLSWTRWGGSAVFLEES